MNKINSKNALAVFQGSNIRRTWHKDEWYFSVVDVINALDASSIPKRYWSDLKIKLKEEGFEAYDLIVQLKLLTSDGKKRLTDCANTKSMFRIIQSIPSRKAEPFKRWLSKVGYDRVKEIENPELAKDRIIETYRAKGYSDEWIEKRIRSMIIRDELTNEWRNRDVKEGKEFAILTSEISKATFGLTPNEYKKHKKLRSQNLRDHMDDLELIFTMLGEKVTTEITKREDKEGFNECKNAAKRGGNVAGKARKETEKEIGRTVVSNENYLRECEKIKRKMLK